MNYAHGDLECDFVILEISLSSQVTFIQIWLLKTIFLEQ
jgi:hypothetical protein